MRHVLVRSARSQLPPLRRSFTSQKHPSSPTPIPSNDPIQSSSYQRLLSRTPKFLRPSLSALHNAPVTHLTAFLLLHEITAVIPLFGLASAFHYCNWLPAYFAEGEWVVAGVEKFGRYFRRRGWISAEEEEEAEREAQKEENISATERTRVWKWRNKGEIGMRWVVEFGTAYAVVKALLPVRIALSVWGAPWFARWTVIPVGNTVRRLFGSGRKMSPGAATNPTVSKRS